MTDLESKTYKGIYKFLYTDEDGIDIYLYYTYKLSLEQIHKCEINYMTKACIIDDGHMCKELTRIDRYWHVTEDGNITTLIYKEDISICKVGYKCLDPWDNPHLYII
jgi:hypothetical protein